MKTKLKWLALALVVIFALLQFTNPPRTNPPVKSDMISAVNPPPAVVTSLHAACYDCHSYETKWPLYSKIAPPSWLVVSDVNEGRRNLNLSEWPSDSTRAAKKLDSINEVLDGHEMPPQKYTMLHPEARLTDEQRQQVMDWADAAATKLRASSTNQ
ncbi:MAG TPA: heme-binding domain-containing protein [Verrucomicrobiae bacterium]|nr:heme-binding domain-containing protein [Verrucomicrobiae bacterium]